MSSLELLYKNRKVGEHLAEREVLFDEAIVVLSRTIKQKYSFSMPLTCSSFVDATDMKRDSRKGWHKGVEKGDSRCAPAIVK